MSTKTKKQTVKTSKTTNSKFSKSKTSVKTPRSVKRKMDDKTVLSFYNARKREGDLFLLSDITGYSKSHICNVSAGRRNINTKIADAMFSISNKRS